MSNVNPQPGLDRASWAAWRKSAQQPAIDTALRDLYQRLDADIASRGPTCWQSGKCCKFGSYGHRLYVTALEVAWFQRQLETDEHAPGTITIGAESSQSLPVLNTNAQTRTPDPDEACPYQIDNQCSTHAIRPLGCRIFFCQDGTEHWQHDLYERYLTELRELHETHRLEYRYADWLALLAEAMASTN